MQTYKKSGLDQAESQFLCAQKKIFLRGIPKNLVSVSKIEVQHLTCFICHQIIWKAVSCGQVNCFANFCEYCVSNYGQETSYLTENAIQPQRKCPKCFNKFLKTSIPLIKNLLSQISFKCAYILSGCNQIISYDNYLKHATNCQYQKIQCQGCSIYFLQLDIADHKRNCEFIIVNCQKCRLRRPQSQFKAFHTEIYCLELQLKTKDSSLKQLQNAVNSLRSRLNSYEAIMQKIIKGDTIPLPIQFYSSFPYNFYFLNSEAKLCKSSWNASKQKYDFLHFYITSHIKTESSVGFHWKMLIKNLKGNLLIGICSSLSTNSLDFVINRFGQIKKKQISQNKYKLIRKGSLTFSEGDLISFQYIALRKTLSIRNETKSVEGRLEVKQISQLGLDLYSFYSLDTVNDCIKFI